MTNSPLAPRAGPILGAWLLALSALLAFTPPKRDGKLHEVSVRVTPGGLKTRAKKNYVAPKA